MKFALHSTRRGLPLALLTAAFSWTPYASAGGSLGENGEAISTSRYSIDLYQGAVWAGSRITSLGGSFVALAYDVDGMLQNPAAPAVRPFFSVTDFDYWLGLGVTFPSSLQGTDFFNTGTKLDSTFSSPDSLIYITPAAILQFGPFGVGANIELQNYGLGDIEDSSGTAKPISTSFNQAHVQTAYAFRKGELTVGGGLRILQMETRIGSLFNRNVPLSATGIGAEVGMLWKPRGQYFSVGAAYRSEIFANSTFSDAAILNSDNDIVISSSRGDFYLPESVRLPWDINLGLVYNLADSRPNEPWRSDATVARRRVLELELEIAKLEERRELELAGATNEIDAQKIEERYQPLLDSLERRIDRVISDGYWEVQQELAYQSRHTAMVTVSLLISGTSPEAVGVESFIRQVINRSGESLVFSPRLGSEVEVIPDWLKLRAGTYLEPTRVETSTVRPHYTGGFDLPLGVWNVFGLWPDDYRWRLGFGADFARDFQTVGFSLAGWYPRHRGPITRKRDYHQGLTESLSLQKAVEGDRQP